KSAQIREILISESAWEEMTCLFAPSLSHLQYKFKSDATG
ncbi:dibenzothiophene desulfurase, partial [Escherichia coli]